MTHINWSITKYFNPHDASVNLNDIIPFPHRPHTILVYVERRGLPVPGFHRNIPVGSIVGHHIVSGFAGNSDLELHQLSPTQTESWEHISVRIQIQIKRYI